MADTTNDIDALLRYLDYLVGADTRWAESVRALVAERNALRERVAELEAASKPHYIFGGGRVESIDLRERLVCAALTAMVMAEASYVDAAEGAVCYADAAFAAMRKGATDGK